MHEQNKIKEAQYFYSLMNTEFDDREKFIYNLSAFITAARTVLQYVFKEAKEKPGGERWYKKLFSDSKVLGFFRDMRNINIHDEPIKPSQHITAVITGKVGISSLLSMIHFDSKGNILGQYSSDTKKPMPKENDIPTEIKTRYKFSDWIGDEDVMSLSQTYLIELQSMVDNGKTRGFLR